MTKGVKKKKNRKLRKQARRTIGALLMVSAIVVAALPVPDVSASIETAPQRVAVVNYLDANMNSYEKIDAKEAPASWQSTIPYVDSDEIIYTTGDGMFQFAFVKPSSEARDEVAVILGANVTNLPDGGSLTIPKTVDAYRKYTANTTSTGYVAVSRNDKFLYYKKQVHQTDDYGYLLYRVPSYLGNETITQYDPHLQLKDDGVSYSYVVKIEYDEDGAEISREAYDAVPVMKDEFFPCYYDTYSEWGGLADNELYYWNGPATAEANAVMAEVTLENYSPYMLETVTVSTDSTIMSNSNQELGISTLSDEEGNYTITVSNDGNGTGTSSPSSATAGTEITLTANPNSGYHFKEWQVESGGVTIINDKFTMPESNVEVKAIFEQDVAQSYTITVSNDGNGTGTSNLSSATAGAEITLTANPNSGYHFKEWQVESGEVNIINDKFTMPESNVEVKAIFEQDIAQSYSITVSNDGNGTGTSSPSSATAGAEITLTANPNNGYHFKEWQVESGGVTIINDKFTMPESNVEVKAIFEQDTSTKYTVTVNNGTGGGEYAADETVTIIANTAPSGKQFKEWTVESRNVTLASATSNETTFTMPAGAVTVTATYEDVSTPTATPGGESTATPKAQDDPTQTQYFTLATTVDNQRIHDAKVQYIGRQYLVGSDGEWKVAGEVTSTNPERGVFAGKGQIVNLTIEDNLLGIGDYAFYGCSGINSVTLGNGLSTIGNGAFANCVNMLQCNMQLNSAIKVIGKDAFMNCRGLTKLVIPVNVEAIGDYCFQGCDGLQDIELCGNGSNVLLNIIGYKAFENCSKLTSITFPDNFTQTYPLGSDWSEIKNKEDGKIPVSCFAGCTSLQYIKIQNTTLDIVDEGFDPVTNDNGKEIGEGDHNQYGTTGTGCSIENFLKTVPDIFYFEGPEISAIHDTAKNHSAAFKYLGQDKFEKVVMCPETKTENNGPHEATFIVNTNNELIEMQIDPNCGEIKIPSNIGAYGVETISSTSFQNNCFLKKIYIPATVKLIETNAFKGCHNLKDVIFEQPENSQLIIQDKAFNTQDVDYHNIDCKNKKLTDESGKPVEPVLTFSGTISPESVPFQYAMNPVNNINVGTQPLTYITYYSGWPTNLTVKYNPDTDKNELLDYPRYSELENYDLNSYPYMTEDYMDAAKTAVSDYETYMRNDQKGTAPTQNQMNIVNSALNINLPAGIEAIADGIFSGVDSANKAVDGQSANTDVQSVTMNTVETVKPYTFAGCTKLNGFYMSGGNKIDDYAFKNCTSLANVSVPSTVTELGLRPFAGCDKLTSVNFNGSPYFSCEDMVIYGLTDGVKTKIIECLEARGELGGNTKVGPEELSGITEVAPEAFKDCDGIGSVDFTASSISSIPEQCFAQTDRLYSVLLPETGKSIKKGAFWNSKVSYLEIPSSVTLIETDAFANVEEDDNKEIKIDSDGSAEVINKTSGHSTITFYCTEGDAADTYADNYYYINPTYYRPIITHKVYFWDDLVDEDNPVLIDTQEVVDGEDAVPPEAPVHDGYTFTGWSNYSGISRDTDVYARYAPIGETLYHVTFMDWDDTILDEQDVVAGKGAKTPPAPTREGYNFTGWRPGYDNITFDVTIYAQYEKIDSDDTKYTVTFYNYDDKVVSVQKVGKGESAVEPVHPTREGYVFEGWKPASYTNVTRDLDVYAQFVPVSPTAAPTAAPSASAPKATDKPQEKSNVTPTPQIVYQEAAKKKYTVSVSGGSGSGSYAAGDIVAINAYYMGSGQVFDQWTTSTAGVGFANSTASSTTFTMPAANVAITATYKTGSSGSASTGGNGGGASNTGGTSSGVTNTGSTVEITKPGISNTGLAGASVTGATDNFVVKVTEDQSATDAAVAALQAKYGDLSRIKYLPMDISLYDSTGRTKIADTTGISVNITLPIPDDLVQYAGNNKIAAVSNGSLEELNARFTTVNGVPCINFTATHFSPYVIYVDTANLTAGTIDATPKTGDPIHPKWFLAIGMACVSLILFFKKDKSGVKAKMA